MRLPAFVVSGVFLIAPFIFAQEPLKLLFPDDSVLNIPAELRTFTWFKDSQGKQFITFHPKNSPGLIIFIGNVPFKREPGWSSMNELWGIMDATGFESEKVDTDQFHDPVVKDYFDSFEKMVQIKKPDSYQGFFVGQKTKISHSGISLFFLIAKPTDFPDLTPAFDQIVNSYDASPVVYQSDEGITTSLFLGAICLLTANIVFIGYCLKKLAALPSRDF